MCIKMSSPQISLILNDRKKAIKKVKFRGNYKEMRNFVTRLTKKVVDKIHIVS